MPELPEAETVRRDVAAAFVGDRLSDVEITGRRTVRRHPAALLSWLEGRTLTDVGRHGKYLLFHWDDGRIMVGHLRMSGQLLRSMPGEPRLPHTHAVFTFAEGAELRFVDPRTFGEFFLAGEGPGGSALGPVAQDELAHLGPDALTVEPAHLRTALAGRRAPLKSLLVDQRVLAGIGNIYADEICFAARLRPDRAGGSLRPAEVARLTGAVHAVLAAAIEARGSTLSDQRYRDMSGAVGQFQLQHKVYDRAGKLCLTCGRPVERVYFGARSAYLCRKCQR